MHTQTMFSSLEDNTKNNVKNRRIFWNSKKWRHLILCCIVHCVLQRVRDRANRWPFDMIWFSLNSYLDARVCVLYMVLQFKCFMHWDILIYSYSSVCAWANVYVFVYFDFTKCNFGESPRANFLFYWIYSAICIMLVHDAVAATITFHSSSLILLPGLFVSHQSAATLALPMLWAALKQYETTLPPSPYFPFD